MKIDNAYPTGTGSPLAPSRPRPGGIASTAESAAADFHPSALAAQLMPQPDESPVDAARVAEIKQAIAEGRFVINSGAIADRLIRTATELLGGQQAA